MKHRIIYIAMLLFVVIPSVWADDDMRKTPLTIQAVNDCTIYFYNAADNVVYYRIDDGEQQEIKARNINSAVRTDIIVKAGEKVTFMCGTGANRYGGTNKTYTYKNGSTYVYSKIVPTNDCYVYGNIMSLITPTKYDVATELESSYTFARLFANYSSPNFNNNPRVLNHPTKDLVLPALYLSENCYREMFRNCNKLTRAPVLPAFRLELNCYHYMFYNCSQLSSLTCLATEPQTYATDSWLYGVAANGTFTLGANEGEVTWGRNASGIPSDWTINTVTTTYAWYDSSTTTLHFRRDNARPKSNSYNAENIGENLKGWSNASFVKDQIITNVVFEDSFKDVRPTSCYRWFYGMSSVTSVTGWENFNTSEVTTMQLMFKGIGDGFTLDFSHFDTGKVTDMSSMFYDCTRTDIDVTGLNTSNVTTMVAMFRGCTNLTSLDLGTFDTGKVTSFSEMFYNCNKLKNLNLTSFNTSQVTNLYYMFYSCGSLESVDLRSFDTSNVTNLTSMFMNCSSLKALDLSSFDTGKVTSFMEMFRGCSGVTMLDLTNFHTVGNPTYSFMFAYCSNLKTILVDDAIWSPIDPNLSTNSMFQGCSSLVGEYGTHVTSTDGTNAHTGTGGYFTKKYRDITAKAAKGSYWTTYYNGNVSRIADSNTSVYTVSLSGNNLSLHEVADRNIKAGQGVLLKSSQENITLANSIYEPTADYTTNSLEGTDTEISNPSVGNTYVLSYKSETDKLGFYKLGSTATIGASKAYLTYEGGSGNYLSWEDETTGISLADSPSTSPDVVYDLQGRRIANDKQQTSKGIYIINGRKVVR